MYLTALAPSPHSIVTQTETTKLFDAHFHAATYGEGGEQLLASANSALDGRPDAAVDAFYGGMRLIFLNRNLKIARIHLRHTGRRVRAASKHGRRVFQLVTAEYYYRRGRYAKCYNKVRQILRELAPPKGENPVSKSKLLRGYFGLNLHHLAGRAAARMGNLEIARIHYGFAFSFEFNKVRYGESREHYLLGSITLDYMRTYLDSRLPMYCERLLNNAKHHFDACFAADHRAGENGKRHLVYLDLLYWQGRMLTKQRASGWFEKVNDLARQMESISTAYENHPMIRRDPRRDFLLGGAHMVRAETYLRQKNGRKDERVIKELQQARRFTKDALDRQTAAAAHPTDPLLSRGLNFLIRIEHLLGQLNGQGIPKLKSQRELRDCILRAYDCNRIGGKRKEASRYDDYRQAFKTAKEEMENTLAKGGAKRRYQLVRGAYDKCYRLLLMGFSHCTSASARAGRYYDFRLVKENMIEAAYARLNSKFFSPRRKEKAVILEHLLSVFTHTDKQDWNLRYANGMDDRGITVDATNLPRIRTMEEAFFRMFRDGFESLTADIGRGDYRRYNGYAYGLLNEHLRRLDIKNPPAEERYALPKPRFNLTHELFFENFSNAQDTGVFCVFKGVRHLYCLCATKKRNGRGELELKRLTNEAYADLKAIDDSVKAYNEAVAELLRYEGSSMPLNKQYVLMQSARADQQGDMANRLNRRFLTASITLYEQLIAPLGVADYHRLYFLFNDYDFQRICLPALFPRPAEVDREEPRIFFKKLDYLGVTHQIANVPSLIDFLEEEEPQSPPPASGESSNGEVLLAHLSYDQSGGGETDNDDLRMSELMKYTARRVENYLKAYCPKEISETGIRRFPRRGVSTYGSNDKRDMLHTLTHARSFFIFTHAELEERKYAPRFRKNYWTRKLMLRMSTTAQGVVSASHEPPPWYLADAYGENAIYFDDLDFKKFPRLSFSLLACCASAYGNETKGYIPRSLLSAFVEAGCSATVGTLFEVDDETIKDFAITFIKNWLGGPNGAGLENGRPRSEREVGAALRATREELSRRHNFHPLAWGAFLLMGRQSVNLGDAFGIRLLNCRS